jgi:hypothetical protein
VIQPPRDVDCYIDVVPVFTHDAKILIDDVTVDFIRNNDVQGQLRLGLEAKSRIAKGNV